MGNLTFLLNISACKPPTYFAYSYRRILEGARENGTSVTEAERGFLLCARSMVAPIREVLWIFPSGVVAPSSSTLCCITLMILIRRNTISPRTLLLRHYRPIPRPTIVAVCAGVRVRYFANTHAYAPVSALRTFIRQQKTNDFLLISDEGCFSPTDPPPFLSPSYNPSFTH